MPDWMDHLSIQHLPTGKGTLSLELTRHRNNNVSIMVQEKSPDWEVQLIQ